MPILEFKEIAQGNNADGEQDSFELFARDFFKYLGYEIIGEPDRGSDNGCDLVIEETLVGIGRKETFRWLVSCKHYAHSAKGTAVGTGHEQGITDRIKSNDCKGFIGFYSTLPSSGLTQKLEGLDELEVQIFDKEKIETTLLKPNDDDAKTIALRYFPLSSNKWEDLSLIHI